MSLSQVNSALTAAYKAGGFFPDAHTAYENVVFNKPSAGTPWAKYVFITANPSVVTLGPVGFNRYDGFVQLDINYPTNTGRGNADAKADAIILYFKTGNKYAYEGQEVIIRTVGRTPGREVDGFYRITLSIFFYANINR